MLASLVSNSLPRDLPALASQSVGITGVSHCAQLRLLFEANSSVTSNTTLLIEQLSSIANIHHLFKSQRHTNKKKKLKSKNNTHLKVVDI